MLILSINAGSSSLKWTLFKMPEETKIGSGVFERIGIDKSFYTIKVNGEKIEKQTNLENHDIAVKILVKELIELNIIKDLKEIKGIGHRVVHGGDKYSDSVIIDKDVLNEIERLIPLAPLHNPANLIGIKSFNELMGSVKSVAVFDTAFHQTMSEASYLYAVPYEWYSKYGVRKYGFHGTSHKYITNKLMTELNDDKLKIISCHLGNGVSISAVDKGKCLDTSLGFTPLTGVPMGTRSGDMDPGIIPYMMEKTNKSIDKIMSDLNKQSGFLGVSGVSSDSREIENGIAEGNHRCRLAQDIFVNKVVAYISSYYTLLNKADAIIFSAGIGERGINIRKEIIDKLSSLGIYLDNEKNQVKAEFAKISTEDSKVACYVVPTDEELMIAQETYQLIED